MQLELHAINPPTRSALVKKVRSMPYPVHNGRLIIMFSLNCANISE